MLGDEVVISGIGANFPQSLNVQDFGSDLLNNKNLATPTNRWKYGETSGNFQIRIFCVYSEWKFVIWNVSLSASLWQKCGAHNYFLWLFTDHELEVNPVCGQVPFENFDQVFYGINKSLAMNTDPVSKMGYQRSFEAVLDAGIQNVDIIATSSDVVSQTIKSDRIAIYPSKMLLALVNLSRWKWSLLYVAL